MLRFFKLSTQSRAGPHMRLILLHQLGKNDGDNDHDDTERVDDKDADADDGGGNKIGYD